MFLEKSGFLAVSSAFLLLGFAGISLAQESAQPSEEGAVIEREAAAPAREEAARLSAPRPPAHKGKNITTASGLAEDLVEVVAYLEKGKAYYAAYRTGTHTVAENAEFLNFLEVYEKELALAKKEVKMLQAWVDAQGALDSKTP